MGCQEARDWPRKVGPRSALMCAMGPNTSRTRQLRWHSVSGNGLPLVQGRCSVYSVHIHKEEIVIELGNSQNWLGSIPLFYPQSQGHYTVQL